MVDEKQRDQERERVFVCSCVWVDIYISGPAFMACLARKSDKYF